MAGRERGKKVREDPEKPDKDEAGVADPEPVIEADAEEEPENNQPIRRVPGINGYDPTQWPDART